MNYTLANILRELKSRGLANSSATNELIRLAEILDITTQNSEHLRRSVASWIDCEISSKELLFECYRTFNPDIKRIPQGVRAPAETRPASAA